MQTLGHFFKDRIKGIAFLQPSIEQSDILDFDLMQFLRAKARSWETSQAEIGTLIASPDVYNGATLNAQLKKMESNNDEIESTDEATDSSDIMVQRKVICPTHSSGVDRWEELILSKTYLRVLDFFETIA